MRTVQLFEQDGSRVTGEAGAGDEPGVEGDGVAPRRQPARVRHPEVGDILLDCDVLILPRGGPAYGHLHRSSRKAATRASLAFSAAQAAAPPPGSPDRRLLDGQPLGAGVRVPADGGEGGASGP